MRLICTSSLELQEFIESPNLEYAILSHRWEEEELSFQDMLRNDKTHTKGYRKMKRFCDRAAQDGFKYAWIDTCCINKESSSELSEAINSMYRWYQESAICYAYLSDVSPNDNQESLYDSLKRSVWFTRGWTLQELIAPSKLLFIASDWSDIGSKARMSFVIRQITTIDESVLKGAPQLEEFSIARRMSWAAHRRTTRVEDIAYCLMGLFNVNMPLLYGEGERAFTRLQEEILRNSADQTLFAWERLRFGIYYDNPSGLLAQSPSDFKNSAGMIPFSFGRNTEPVSVTNRGIRVHLPMLEGDEYNGLVLECQDTSQKELTLPTIAVRGPGGNNQYVRVRGQLKHLSQLSKAFSTVPASIYVATSLRTAGPNVDECEIYHNSTSTPKGTPKRLVLCIDGPYYKNKETPNITSNIRKIHHMLDDTNGAQISYYDQVGGKSPKSIESCVISSYKWLTKHYCVGDKVFFVGFSTGGYAALYLTKMIVYFGIVKASPTISINDAWKVYHAWHDTTIKGAPYDRIEKRSRYWEMVQFRQVYCESAGRAEFVGCFDTLDTQARINEIKNQSRMVRHAVAIDERRYKRPQPMDRLFRGEESDIMEIWFPGGHADLGGLAPLQPGETWALGHIPLVWMVREAIKAGIRFDLLKTRTQLGFHGDLNNSSIESFFSSEELYESVRHAARHGCLHDTFQSLPYFIMWFAFLAPKTPRKSDRMLDELGFRQRIKAAYLSPRVIDYGNVHLSAALRWHRSPTNYRPYVLRDRLDDGSFRNAPPETMRMRCGRRDRPVDEGDPIGRFYFHLSNEFA